MKFCRASTSTKLWTSLCHWLSNRSVVLYLMRENWVRKIVIELALVATLIFWKMSKMFYDYLKPHKRLDLNQNLRKFLSSAQITKNGCQITTLRNLSQSEKLSEIKPPLERSWISSLPFRCCPPMAWWYKDWTLYMLLGPPMLFCFWMLLDDPKMSNLIHLFSLHPCEGDPQPMLYP